jgi:hypothetical protein
MLDSMDIVPQTIEKVATKRSNWLVFVLVFILVGTLCIAIVSSFNDLNKLLVTPDPIQNTRVKKSDIPTSEVISIEKQQIDLMNYNLVRPLTEFTKKIDHWETYKNERFGFSFEYPNTYINIVNDFDKEMGHVLSIMGFNGKARSLMNKPNPGYFTQITVSYWEDINNEYLKGGTWVDERTYSDLEDFLSDSEHTFITKKGMTTIDGKKAYILSMPGEGAYDAIMLEHNGGYLRIDFPNDIYPIDDSIKRRFLSSFHLL